MLYILLPESRQAASRSLDSTSSSVESCKQIHLYVQTCICCSQPPLPPPLFTLPLLRFTSCYSRAQSIFQVFTAAAGTDGDWETDREREKEGERETEGKGLRWAKSKLNTRPPKANTTVRDSSVTRAEGGTIYKQLSRNYARLNASWSLLWILLVLFFGKYLYFVMAGWHDQATNYAILNRISMFHRILIFCLFFFQYFLLLLRIFIIGVTSTLKCLKTNLDSDSIF